MVKIVHILDKYLNYRQDFRSKNVLSSSLNMRKLAEQEENANFFFLNEHGLIHFTNKQQASLIQVITDEDESGRTKLLKLVWPD